MKQLTPYSILAPGFWGVNTQDSTVSLPSNFATKASNCIIDKFGRLGSRKGWVMQTTTGSTALAGEKVAFLMEHVNANNTTTVLSGGNNKLFSGGVGAVLTNITPAAYSITANDWKGASIKDLALLVQASHPPIVYDETNSPVAEKLIDYDVHTPSFGTSYPRDVIAAYGRFWAHDGEKIYWSTDILDASFPRFSGGSSGTLNIAAVLPNNADTIVALAAHNGFLIIFCQHNVVIYRGADDPTGDIFGLQDVIVNVGCIARDSVQNIGNDLLFLSDSGVRSFSRIVQEKSLPMKDLTTNVRDDVIAFAALELNKNKIKSVYSENNAFYLLSFPQRDTVLCMDTRKPADDLTARCTFWVKYPSGALLSRRNNDLLVGKTNGIGKYTGYLDNGASYRLQYRSNYIDFQEPTSTKIVKKARVVVVGGSNQPFNVTLGYDYRSAEWKYPLTIYEEAVYEYGIAEYGLSSWSAGVAVDDITTPTNGTGKALQIGFDADVKGVEISVQRLDIFIKQGRIN
jgi:hypothetical protein